jgi:hypothetical protein
LQDGDTLQTYNVSDGHTLHMVIRPLNRPPRSASEGTEFDHAQERPMPMSSLLDGLLGGGNGSRVFNMGGGGGGGGNEVNNAASAAATRLLMMSALGNSLRPTPTPTIFPVSMLFSHCI